MYMNELTMLENWLREIDAFPITESRRRHGSPYDRGAADSWYRRGCAPHYYVGATMASDKVEEEDMSKQEVWEYEYGYYENEMAGGHKDWGRDD